MTITKKPDTRPAPASWGLAASGRLPWEYASAPEATDHVSIERSYGLFIDNEFSPAKGRGTFEVLNPATEEPLSRVAKATPADVDRAVGGGGGPPPPGGGGEGGRAGAAGTGGE